MLELKPCPQCGKKVLIVYACGEYFIFSREKTDCACNNFTEMHSSMNQEVEAWNKFCEAERSFYENQKNHKPVQGE